MRGSNTENISSKKVLIRELSLKKDDDEYYDPGKDKPKEKFETAGIAFAKSLQAQGRKTPNKPPKEKEIRKNS